MVPGMPLHHTVGQLPPLGVGASRDHQVASNAFSVPTDYWLPRFPTGASSFSNVWALLGWEFLFSLSVEGEHGTQREGKEGSARQAFRGARREAAVIAHGGPGSQQCPGSTVGPGGLP